MATLVIVGAALLVALGASAVHAWHMEGAALSCDAGTLIRGGWAEQSVCAVGTGEHPAVHEPRHLLDPWTSALTAGAIIAGFVALSVRAIAALNGITVWSALRRFALIAAVVVGLSVLLCRTLLVLS